MAGMLIPFLNKSRFEYNFLPLTPGTAIVVLARAINVVPYATATLAVRFHEKDFGGDIANDFTIEVFDTDPSNEDPAEFTATPAVPGLSITLNKDTPTPGLVLAMATSTIKGPFYKITLTAKRGENNPLYGEISADLVLRESS